MLATRLTFAGGLLALTLGACAPMEGGGGGSMPPAGPPDEADQCKASQYQRWVGRNRSQLPQPPAGETWRVTCTTCPVTMDYNPRRLNILYDEQSGVIEQVKCG